MLRQYLHSLPGNLQKVPKAKAKQLDALDYFKLTEQVSERNRELVEKNRGYPEFGSIFSFLAYKMARDNSCSHPWGLRPLFRRCIAGWQQCVLPLEKANGF